MLNLSKGLNYCLFNDFFCLFIQFNDSPIFLSSDLELIAFNHQFIGYIVRAFIYWMFI